MVTDSALRELVGRLLAWEDAHVGYDAAVAGIAPEQRGVQPHGLPHSAWQLIEHLRITQWDILDFCRNPQYREMRWPDDYWPASPEPPSPDAGTRRFDSSSTTGARCRRWPPIRPSTSAPAFRTAAARRICGSSCSWATTRRITSAS